MLHVITALAVAGAVVIATAQAAIPVSKAPVAKPSGQEAIGLTQALIRAGRFNIFLTLMKTAGIQEGSLRGVTILTPSDAAFAAMDKGKLDALKKDPAAARIFISGHIIKQPLLVADLFNAGDPTSKKSFQVSTGGEVQVQCNGMPHVGLHHPVINGRAKVAALQDLRFSGGVIHEIDGVLAR